MEQPLERERLAMDIVGPKSDNGNKYIHSRDE
jgi:hypothetical protein